MKSTLAAASCIYVGVVIDEFVVSQSSFCGGFLSSLPCTFYSSLSLQTHAFQYLSLVSDRKLDVFTAPSCVGIAAG
jgi:hypothetical protein